MTQSARRQEKDPPLQKKVRENLNTTQRMRRRAEEKKTLEDRFADGVTRLAGSMKFVYFHALFFGGWIVVNLGWIPRISPYDPFPFVMLAMIASVEAIFLSTFILISQNRMSMLAESRNELNLQITLLTEHEVTRLVALTDGIAQKLGVKVEGVEDTAELKRDVPHEKVIREIEKVQKS